MKAILSAIQFLTIVPVRIPGELSPSDLGRSCGWYPLVGALQGILGAVLAVLLSRILPPGLTACLFVLVAVLLTGGFHQDGLSDTLDAIAVRTRGNLEEARIRRLAVMKGSTAGPMGVTGVVLSLLIKVFSVMAIVELAVSRPGLLLATLAAVPVLGKWSMVSPLVFGRPARQEGLGATVMTHAGPTEFIGALGTTLAFTVLVALIFVPPGMRAGYVALICGGIAALYLLSVLVRGLAGRAFGGLTGDVFGFTNEISEMVYLVLATGWLRLST